MSKLTKSFRIILKPKPPYNFQITMQKPAGWSLFTPFEIAAKDVLWTALHIDGLLIGLRLNSLGSSRRPKIAIDVFARKKISSEQKEKIKAALIYRLGINEDLSGFYKMARGDSILKHVLPDLYGMRDTSPSHLFAEATLAITLQMAPWKRSEEMMNCLIKTYGEQANFDGKKVSVWPTAAEISRHRPSELARRCKLGYRAKLLVKLARRLAKGFKSIEDLEKLSPEESRQMLLELPGVGDYSADILNPHGGFPIDVWSAEVFSKLLYGRTLKGRDSIERIKACGLKRWGKWSWLAFFYVVQDLENLSRKLGVKLRLY
jgi:DNA-3-methyladenine glycosylase II